METEDEDKDKPETADDEDEDEEEVVSPLVYTLKKREVGRLIRDADFSTAKEGSVLRHIVGVDARNCGVCGAFGSSLLHVGSGKRVECPLCFGTKPP